MDVKTIVFGLASFLAVAVLFSSGLITALTEPLSG